MYAVLDIETGGFSKTKNGICEIAIIFLDENFERIDDFSSMIKPYKRPDSDEFVSYKEPAMLVHGITMDQLLKAPLAFHVAGLIEQQFKDHNTTIIVGHNVKSFDKVWIEYFLKRFGVGYKFDDYICTLELARAKDLGLENNKLSTLCEHFGIESLQAHRALSDATDTLDLWLKLKQ